MEGRDLSGVARMNETLLHEPELPVQLWALRHELRGTLDRALDLIEYVAPEFWTYVPAPGSWSVGACLEHLNATSRAFLPLLQSAIQSAHEQNLPANRPYRRDAMGWLLCRMNEPPVRIKIRTKKTFDPPVVGDRDDVLRQFGSFQFELFRLINEASGRAIDRVKIPSPFDPRVRYNVYSAFLLIAAHQRRHLWQAEQILLNLKEDHRSHAKTFLSGV